MSIRVEASRSVPHGIVFVYDPTMVIDIPHDTGAAPVLATTNCVSVWTQHEDEGVVQLVIASSFEDNDCLLVYEGTIISGGRKLAINTSDCVAVIEVDVLTDATALMIYANDAWFPTRIICVVGPQYS